MTPTCFIKYGSNPANPPGSDRRLYGYGEDAEVFHFRCTMPCLRKPRISICIPSGTTEIERKAVEEATYQAGARDVFLVEEPIAAAIGAGVDVTKPFGNLIVDIGGGTTDVAVISMAGSVVSASVKVAGDYFDQAIMSYVRKNHSLFIGKEAAENIKIKIGTACQEASPRDAGRK